MITLTTDFGTADPYVGVMKGVILSINPKTSIVDITHQIQPQSIQEGAFIIGHSHRFFPKGTIHVVVVDPGVGTSRAATLLVTPSASFLAPDNGVLSHIVRQGFSQESEGKDITLPVKASQVDLPQNYRAYELTDSEYWLDPVSSTFHGRDIFAPVAAHLSLGLPADRLGREVDHLTWLPISQPEHDENCLTGRVVHIDRFGNLITNVLADLLPRDGTITVEVNGHNIAGLSPSYEEGGWLLAIAGSYGYLEVSVRNGSAAQKLQATVGNPVRVIWG